MSRESIIYLADLTHTTITISTDTFPLGVGYLASYTLENIECSRIKPVIRIFRFYKDLMQAVLERPPHILGVTNYSWNLHLSKHALCLSKQINPAVLTIMGGPNIPITSNEQKVFFESSPEVDIYVLGEGEQTFCKLVRTFADCGMQREETLISELPNCLVRRPDGTVAGEMGLHAKRLARLDEIPSPYLTGLMDQFFGTKLYPMIETCRGCPFSCTFCHQGSDYYRKINRFSLERVFAELKYIAAHSQASDTLFIADSNFGMYQRGVEIAAFIGALQRKTSWPKYINCTTGKNNPETVVKAVELLNGAMVISASVQSTSETVLKNIRRSNIKLSTFSEMQATSKERGLKSVTDMILCLPGETKESHFQGVRQLLDSGTQRILPYQLMLLDGTEINTPETRTRYAFQSRHRIVPRNFGLYNGEVIAESEETVVSTNTLSFEDYLECRKLHLLLEIYFKEEPFRELFDLAKINGVNKSDIIFSMLDSVSLMPTDLYQIIETFLDDTQNELFESRKALERFATAHSNDLISSKFGANLLQKYSVTVWFLHLNSAVDFLEQTIINLADKVITDVEKLQESHRQVSSVGSYLKSSYVNIFDNNSLQEVKRVSLAYNVIEWIKDGCKQTLEHYKISEVNGQERLGPCYQDFALKMSEPRVRYIRDKLSTFGTSKASVGKMLTRMWLSDLRRDIAERIS